MSIEPIPGEPTRFVVHSETRRDYAFIVDMDYEGRPACGCEHFQSRGLECKHIRAVRKAAVRCLTSPLH